ncbi:MAG: CGNR zinc finger domain-containing protein [Dehalococcoidia bacterium]|nr:CGNR zinc finger domain-containing protein [Dehalococcoidia bacterium]
MEGHHPDLWAADVFSFMAGNLALDFANTAGMHEPLNDEHLVDYEALAAWAAAAGLLDEAAARGLAARGRARPEEASAALAAALRLRLAVYRLAAAAVAGSAPPAAAVQVLDAALGDTFSRLRVVPAAEGLAWQWQGAAEDLASPLWPVALSAARLFSAPERLARVRECGGDRCQWLFLDTSRNGTRRWCSMAACGNRAKAKRHYQRSRGQPT